MIQNQSPRSGGQILVDQLVIQGVERITCVPGESYLAALDAMLDVDLDVLICRHEGGAAMMAEAYGKLTAKPGICFVTRGPGATNAAHGVHIAAHDSTPMILFIGQAKRGGLGREGFQELDYKQLFGDLAKWVVEIDRAERIPELITRAFRMATQGRPGPIVVSLPEDMLSDMAVCVDAPKIMPVITSPCEEDLATFKALLLSAKAPLIILGGSGWDEAGYEAIHDFALRFHLPVSTSFRRTHLFNALHPSFAGDIGLGINPALSKRIKDSDLIVIIGGRLSEVPSASYTLLDIPKPNQTLIHIYPDPAEIGRIYQPDLGIVAAPQAMAKALRDMAPPKQIAWIEATQQAHQEYLAWTETPQSVPGDFQYGEVMVWLRDRMPIDTIICNGAGNYSIWVHRFWRHQKLGTQVAPTSGSVGYSVPVGVMTKRHFPDRPVVVFSGDGCFLMQGQEFAVAVQYSINVIIVIIDNGMYATIRMHQERDFPNRVIGTDLNNPDFAALARAYGGHGETVHKTSEFAPAFERALVCGKPAIIHCFIDPQAITPAQTIDQIRQRK
ncbi:MAG: thiamine pyrophosphate-binding protein [Pirellula sp.]